MQQSGQLESAQAQMVKRVKAHVLRPTPVAGLTPVTDTQTRRFDPTITLTAPIRNAQGTILFPAGTRVNPLDRVPFTEALVFFNSDDPRQVKRVQHYLQAHPTERVKLILTDGDIAQTAKAFHQQHRIYFDQQGALTHHFGLQHVPALIVADGDQLRITIWGLHTPSAGGDS